MRLSLAKSRSAHWTLVDQCIVSLGNFGVTLLLARLLTPAEYGFYSLLLLLMLGLQTISSSLLFYPLSVRGTVLGADERALLFGGGLVVLGGLCALLALLLAGVLSLLGRPDLIVPGIVWLVLWQVQELMRRALLSDMRYAAAVPGDAVSYLGQAAGVLALAMTASLTLTTALFVMAATSGLAALIQAMQATIRPRTTRLLETVRQCWVIGRFSLVSNLLSSARIQVFPWALTALGGTALAAQFQAAQNLVLAANPVLLGLCNVIPQAAARGRKEAGVAQAWRSALSYVLFGAIPVFSYYILLLVCPGWTLALLYGGSSPYLGLTFAVRAMSVAALIAYAAEMVCSYFHGLEAAQLAMRVNTVGLVASLLIGLPLTLAWGLPGGCIGLLITSVVRSIAATQVLTFMIVRERRGFAPVV